MEYITRCTETFPFGIRMRRSAGVDLLQAWARPPANHSASACVGACEISQRGSPRAVHPPVSTNGRAMLRIEGSVTNDGRWCCRSLDFQPTRLSWT